MVYQYNGQLGNKDYIFTPKAGYMNKVFFLNILALNNSQNVLSFINIVNMLVLLLKMLKVYQKRRYV